MFSYTSTPQSRDASVGIETRLRAGQQRSQDSIPGMGKRFIYLFSITSRPALGYTKRSIQRALRVGSPGVKRPGRAVHHSHQSNAEVRNGGAIPPVLHVSSWRIT
jgi:hypothetical protein